MSPLFEKLIVEMYLAQQKPSVEFKALRAQLAGQSEITNGWLRSSKAAIALKPESVLNAPPLRKLARAGVFTAAKGEIRNIS